MTVGQLPADVLILVDGTRLEGRVDEVVGARDRIAFTSGSGRIELPLERIRERIDEPDAMDWTRVGNQFADARNFPLAVQMFQRALEADPDFADAKAGMARAQDAISADQDARRRAAQDAVTRDLELVPEMIAAEKFDETLALLNRLMQNENASAEQRVTAQRLLRDLHLAWGFSRWDRTDNKGAEEHYQRVLEMDPDNQEARDRLLVIWRDDPSKRAEVLKAYQAKLAAEPNNLQLNQIVGDLLFRDERWEEAIEPFKKVASAPRFAGQGYDTKLRRSYQMSINAAADAGNLDKAIALTQEMMGIFTNSDDTGLKVLTYERDKSRLARDDYEGQALLARRLYNEGLTTYAEREALLILRYDPENKIAEGILRQESEERLARIQLNFQQQDFLVARNLAARFVQEEKRFGDLIMRAEEILKKSEIEVSRQQRENRETAMRLAENGIQAYNEALRYVDLMTDSNRRTNTFVQSNKAEAVKNARRAIERFDVALQIDPSLGPPTGMDLIARRRDAVQLLNQLTDAARPLPRPRRFSN
jgi:hypothetical protein